MPCLVILHSLRIDNQRCQPWLQVVVLYTRRLEIAMKCVLIWGARMVGDLELGLVAIRIIVQVNVASFGKPVVGWSRRRVTEEVVDVRETGILSEAEASSHIPPDSQCGQQLVSRSCGHPSLLSFFAGLLVCAGS